MRHRLHTSAPPQRRSRERAQASSDPTGRGERPAHPSVRRAASLIHHALVGASVALLLVGCARNAERIVPTLDVGVAADTDADSSTGADTSADATISPDADPADAANDVSVNCDQGCPEFCQTPLICAADGTEWCNECELQCAGAGPAVDTAFCNGCELSAEWTRIPSRNIAIPDDCASEVAFAIVVDSADFLDQLFQCEAGPLSGRVDVDFASEQLFLWIGFENPNTRIAGVFDDGSNLWVYAVEQAYCSGVPPAPLYHRLVAFEPVESRPSVLGQSCQYGTCGDPPPP